MHFLSIFSIFTAFLFNSLIIVIQPFFSSNLEEKIQSEVLSSVFFEIFSRFFWMWKSKYLYFLVIFLVKKKFSNNDMIITVLKSYCDTFEQFETLRRQLTNAHFWLVDSTSEDSIKRIAIESWPVPIRWHRREK